MQYSRLYIESLKCVNVPYEFVGSTKYITCRHVRQDHTFHPVYTRTYLGTISRTDVSSFFNYLKASNVIWRSLYSDFDNLEIFLIRRDKYQKYQKYKHDNKSKRVPIRPNIIMRHVQHAREPFCSGEENMVERWVGFPRDWERIRWIRQGAQRFKRLHIPFIAEKRLRKSQKPLK